MIPKLPRNGIKIHQKSASGRKWRPSILSNPLNENPAFLIKTLQEHQSKQNQLEQEKLSNQNLSNIEKLNSQTHSMFIGNANSDIQIFELTYSVWIICSGLSTQYATRYSN